MAATGQEVKLAIGLTDDEVVALAVRREAAWLGTLPTVDVNDEVQLFAAATRGNRSLAVRGLLPDPEGGPGQGDGSEVVAAVAAAAGVTPGLVAYAAQPDDLFTPLATSVAVYLLKSGAYLVDACLTNGIHDLVVRSAAEAQELVDAMVGKVVADGMGPGSQETAFVVLTSSDEGQRMAVIADGQARLGDLTLDGSAVSVEFTGPSAPLPESFLVLG